MVGIYDATFDDVYRYLHRLCRDHSLAEDVSQDVYESLLLDSVDLGPVTLAWLKRVARNRLIDVLRRRENYERKLRLMATLETHACFESFDEGLLDLRVRDALTALPPMHRLVLMLRFGEDLTVKQIGVAIGRTTRGAEGLLARAKEGFQQEMEASHE